MSNGSPGPHGVRAAYEGTKFHVDEGSPVAKIGIVIGDKLIVTTVDRKTGKVVSTEPAALGVLD
jgi:hypothetical protein